MFLEVWGDMAGRQRSPGQYEAEWQVLHDPDELGCRARLLYGLVALFGGESHNWQTRGPVAQMPAGGLIAEVLQKALYLEVWQKDWVPDEAMGLHDLEMAAPWVRLLLRLANGAAFQLRHSQPRLAGRHE